MLALPLGAKGRFPCAFTALTLVCISLPCAAAPSSPAQPTPSLPTASLGPVNEDENLTAFNRLAESFLEPREAARREECLDAMLKLAWDNRHARARLKETLEEAWQQSLRTLDDPATAKPFTKLLQARARIDALRKQTLALIHDEANYPYPFQAPDATPAQLRRYEESQATIERRLKALDKELKKAPRVRLSKSARGAREMLLLVAKAAAELQEQTRMTFALSTAGVPGWALGLPSPGEVKGDKITVDSFGLSYEEGQALAESRAVVALNLELRAQALETTKNRRHVNALFDQVAVTNEYRRRLGLRALAWNPQLQTACDGHATYLDEAGEFSHFQPNPAFKDYTARARHAGYESKVYENCQRGANSPQGAHESLAKSSEHHRNLTQNAINEMATGRSERIWVQNFGMGTDFREKLVLGPWWTFGGIKGR